MGMGALLAGGTSLFLDYQQNVLGCVGRGDFFDDYLGQTEAKYRFLNGVINIIKHAHDLIIVDQSKFPAMIANQVVAFTYECRLFTVFIQGRIIPAKDRPFRGSGLLMHTVPVSLGLTESAGRSSPRSPPSEATIASMKRSLWRLRQGEWGAYNPST